MIIALDLDGTLIDCRRRQVECMASIFARRQMPFDRERFWGLKREGASTRRALMEMSHGLEQSQEMSDEWAGQIENAYWLGYDRAFPGVSGILGELRQSRKATLILITARRSERLFLHQMRSLRLDAFFSQKICVNPLSAAQAKANALKAARPSIYIGDTESDCQAAALAGVEFAAVTSGQRSANYLSKKQITTADDIGHIVYPHEAS